MIRSLTARTVRRRPSPQAGAAPLPAGASSERSGMDTCVWGLRLLADRGGINIPTDAAPYLQSGVRCELGAIAACHPVSGHCLDQAWPGLLASLQSSRNLTIIGP